MKKRFITLAVSFILIALLNLQSFGQDKPRRIGVKLGMPNIAGLNLEYVTPLLGEKLAAQVDLSYFSLTVSDVKVSFSYIEAGANYYLIREGKGLYANASYGLIGFKGTWENELNEEGEGKVSISRVNLKVGAKWGGIVYFRPEIGYAFGLGNSKIEVEYPTVTEEEDIPGFLAGGLVVNIGFGVSF